MVKERHRAIFNGGCVRNEISLLELTTLCVACCFSFGQKGRIKQFRKFLFLVIARGVSWSP